jgi:hypothetical protein
MAFKFAISRDFFGTFVTRRLTVVVELFRILRQSCDQGTGVLQWTDGA